MSHTKKKQDVRPSNPLTNPQEKVALETWNEIEESIKATADALPVALQAFAPYLEKTLRQAVVLQTLGKHALLPFNETLEACGISRSVGEKLRETQQVDPVVVTKSKNPKLYITTGAWRDLVDRLDIAPPPSKSKLSKAKFRKQYE